jgi:hypothetical protein
MPLYRPCCRCSSCFVVPAVAGVPVIAAGIIDFASAAVVLGLVPSSLQLLSLSLLLLSSS